MKKEIWKNCSGFEQFYEISSNGEVRSKKDGKLRTKYKICSGTRKIYCVNSVSLWNGNRYIFTSVHRLVAKTFIENPFNKPEVNHIDNNPLNNNISNLEWCTRQENNDWCTKQRRKVHGENHQDSKLKSSEVKLMRKLYSQGLITKPELAKKYNVSKTTIWKIINNQKWKYI